MDRELSLTHGQLRQILPHLYNALLRRQYRALVNCLGLEFFQQSPLPFCQEIAAAFSPPTTPAGADIRLLADLVLDLLAPALSPRAEQIIHQALTEVEEAYEATKAAPGGWGRKGTPEKRRQAVLMWYRDNRPRLMMITEHFLKDRRLYHECGGQEKRNFHARLLSNIIDCHLKAGTTEAEISNYLKRLREGGRKLEMLLSGKLPP